MIPVGKGLGLGLCVRRHARPKILTCGGTMLRAVFLLHICSNYYIYVVELTKALDLDRNSRGFVDKALIAHKPLH